MQDFVYIFAEFLCVTALRIQASSLSLSRSAKAKLSKVVLTYVYLYLYSFFSGLCIRMLPLYPKNIFLLEDSFEKLSSVRLTINETYHSDTTFFLINFNYLFLSLSLKLDLLAYKWSRSFYRNSF